MIKRGIILWMVAACCIGVWATSFDTQRLERIAGYLNLQRLDTLPVGVTNTYYYKKHPLTIRKNQWGEVEHIGFLLLPQSYRRQMPLPVCDFLERYLLARLVTPANTEDATKMQWDKVHFTMGSAATALKLDTTAIFSNEYVDLHVYRVSWTVGGKKVLEMSFAMNIQMLMGCDAVELEHRYVRHLSRYQARPLSQPLFTGFPKDATEYTRADSYYMSPMVRNDIYYTRKSKKKAWMLVDDADRPTKTISNWMVSPYSDNNLPMKLTMDKYGYQLDSLQTSYRTWQQLCMDEGCQPYYGLKAKKNGVYESSVFMVNKKGGYVHLLSIDIPERALKDRNGATCSARMYAYIPLFNVSAKLLHNTEYEPIK